MLTVRLAAARQPGGSIQGGRLGRAALQGGSGQCGAAGGATPGWGQLPLCGPQGSPRLDAPPPLFARRGVNTAVASLSDST